MGKTGGITLVTRLLQVASGVWVTRQLAPSEFGVLAAVFAVQGLADRFTSLNLASSLVRAHKVTREELYVSWSYNLLRGVVLALIVCLLGPYIAAWMGKPTASHALQITSVSFILLALQNPRLLELRREGRFGTLGMVEAVGPVIYAMVSVLFVTVNKTFWALIYAGLVTSFIGSVATYFILPCRPKFSLEWNLAKPMFAFGLVLTGNSMLSALREHGMVFLLAAYGLSGMLGYYNRAIAFSWSLAFQFIVVFWKVAYPLFSRAEIRGENSFHLAARFQNIALITGLPLGIALVASGKWLVPFALGSQWTPMIPLWSLLVIASVLALAAAPYETAFQAAHRERAGLGIYAVLTFVQLTASALLIPALGLCGIGAGILGAQLLSCLIFRSLAGRFPRSSSHLQDSC